MQSTGQLKSIVLTYADSATMDVKVTIDDSHIVIARESGSMWRKSLTKPLQTVTGTLDLMIRDEAGIPMLDTLSEVKDPRDAKKAAGSGDGSWTKENKIEVSTVS